jgi:hypothetical protein
MRTIIAVCTALLVAGCLTTRVTLLDGSTYPPVAEEEVRVHLARGSLPAGCVRFAAIHARGDVDLTDASQMVRAGRRRAAAIGANALVIDHIREPSTGTQIAAVVLGTPDPRRGRMIAYRCPDAEDPGTEPEDAVADSALVAG